MSNSHTCRIAQNFQHLAMLSVYARKMSGHISELSFDDNDTDYDVTYNPNSKDLNSTDTEYSSDLSDEAKKDLEIGRKLKQDWKNLLQNIIKRTNHTQHADNETPSNRRQ